MQTDEVGASKLGDSKISGDTVGDAKTGAGKEDTSSASQRSGEL